MDYESLAKKIIDLLGGSNNITKSVHCFTRLRFNLKDNNKVNLEAFKSLDGVLGAQFQGDQFQVIIGNEVQEVYKYVIKELGPEFSEDIIQENDSPKGKKSILSTIFDVISGIFTPVLPAIIGAGLLKGILSLLLVTKVLTETSGIYFMLNIISDASFYFLPFLLAISAAKKFDTNQYLALAVAGSLFYPTFTEMVSGATEQVAIFGINIPAVPYATSVMPIILAVWLLSYVYRFFSKYVLKVLQVIVTPVLTLLVVVPITFFLLGPLGAFIGKYMAEISLWIAKYVPALYGLIIGGFYPFIIMTGMHYAFFPTMLENISKLGFENGFLPVSLFANMAQAGAVLAVAVVIKNKKMKETAYSSSISAFFGITEPALYGVSMKLRPALISAMIAGAISSAIGMQLAVKMYSFVSPGVLSLPTFVAPSGSMTSLYVALICSAISLIISFVLTFIASKKIDFDGLL